MYQLTVWPLASLRIFFHCELVYVVVPIALDGAVAITPGIVATSMTTNSFINNLNFILTPLSSTWEL